MIVPLKHIERGDFGSHDFDENRGFFADLGNPGFRGSGGCAGGCAALLRNVFFGVILTQNLTRPFSGCFPSKNTRKRPRELPCRKSEKSGPKSVTPKNPFFWPFLAFFGPFLDPFWTPKKPHFLAFFGLFWPFFRKNPFLRYFDFRRQTNSSKKGQKWLPASNGFFPFFPLFPPFSCFNRKIPFLPPFALLALISPY